MRNRFMSFGIFFTVVLLFSSPAIAQVYFPSAGGHRRSRIGSSGESSAHTRL